AARENDLGDVRQIVFTLIVLRLDFAQGVKQRLGFKTVDAGIDLADLALFFRGVALLDDFSKMAIGVANDAPVAGRIVETNTQYRTVSTCVVVLFDQLSQCLDPNHWNIAIHNEDQRLGIFQDAARRFNRIPCASLFLLHHEARQLANFSQYRTLNFFSLVAYDRDDRLRFQRLHGPQGVRNQW